MTPARGVVAALVLALAVPATAHADQPSGPVGPAFTSVGSDPVAFSGSVWFAANDGASGSELWRTDGTAAGTVRVADLQPGAASSSPHELTVVGSRLYFNATPAGTGLSETVYYVDAAAPDTVTAAQASPAIDGSSAAVGTVFGTVNGKALISRLEDGNDVYAIYALGDTGTTFTKISSGTNAIDTTNVTTYGAAVGGWFYYLGYNTTPPGPIDGGELWRTNGSTTTQKVTDINPGNGGITGSSPADFVATSNRVYFTADDGTHGRELWVSDGSPAGTQLLRDQNPDEDSTAIFSSSANGDTLYFVAKDATTGAEPWRTDGTPAGTRVVRDITPGSGGYDDSEVFALGAGFGLRRGGEIWGSDGTSAGTTLLATADSDGVGPGGFTVVGSGADQRVYFRAGFSPYGSVVWRSDLTAAGTLALTAGAFDPPAAPGGPLPGPFTELGDAVVYFGRPLASSASVSVHVIDRSQPDLVRAVTAAPAVAGSGVVDQPLSGTPGTWSRASTYAYQWLRNGVPIAGATATAYTPRPGDVGAQVALQVTARGLGAPNVVSALSNAVAVTAAAGSQPPPAAQALSVSSAGKITGKARVGKRLKVSAPTFTTSGVQLSYRWLANGKTVKGAIGPKLKLTKKQKGKRVSVEVTATKAGLAPLVLTLGPTGQVKGR